MANSVDPDHRPRTAASDVGLHCLQRAICPNTKGYYDNYFLTSNNYSLKLRKTCLTDIINLIRIA